VMHVTTLFPSRREGNRTEGSVTLVQLEPTGDGPKRATLVATYRTRDGERHRTNRTVEFRGHEPEYFGTSGVRKAVALARYSELARSWAAYERRKAAGRGPSTPRAGDGIPVITATGGSEWEQRSLDLQVSPVYRERFDRFADYFAREKRALGSDRMAKDLAVVRALANGTRTTPTATPTPALEPASTPTVTPGEPGEGIA
jgi:Ca-activated chloride channel family protein